MAIALAAIGCAAVAQRVSFTATGPCSASGNCVSSPSYPSSYSNSQRCSITAHSSGTISVTAFSTEQNYDRLTVGGRSYSGNNDGPSGVSVSAGDSISWHSDGSVTRPGWEICIGGSASAPAGNPESVSAGGSYSFTIARREHWRPQLCGCDGEVTLSTCGASGTLHDTVIQLPCYNDDACGVGSRCSTTVNGCTQLDIKGYSNSHGSSTLTISACRSSASTPTPEPYLGLVEEGGGEAQIDEGTGHQESDSPCEHGPPQAIIECLQNNNVSMQEVGEHFQAIEGQARHRPGPNSLMPAVDAFCQAYEVVRPCWSEMTDVARTCLQDESADATQGPPPGVRVAFLADNARNALRCLPHLCDTENTRMVSRAISRVVSYAANQGNVRQQSGPGGPGGPGLPPQVMACMQLPAVQNVTRCVMQNGIVGRLGAVQPVPIPPHGPPHAPFGRTEFCSIYHAVEPCWADLSPAVTGCANEILQQLPQWSTLTAQQQSRPEDLLNCLLQPIPQYCSNSTATAAALNRKVRHASVPFHRAIKAAQKAQGTSRFAAVSAFVLLAAIVGAVAVYRRQPAAEAEKDALYGTL